MENALNRWIGYISISVIAIVGILLATGMVGYLDPTFRFIAAAVIFGYVIIRILFILIARKKPRSSRGYRGRNDYEDVNDTNPNNT